MLRTLGRTNLVAAVALLALGFALRPLPTDPDRAVQATEILGAFLIFAFWACCTVSWGFVLRRPLAAEDDGLFAPVALGLLGASFTAGLLGHLGLIGPNRFELLVALCLAGPVLLAWQLENASAPRGRRSGQVSLSDLVLDPATAIFALLALSLLARLVMASIPYFESDPLWDHLVGPRYWSDAGRIYRPGRDPLVFKSGLWQYLLIWGNGLLTGPDGLGLLEGHLFGQWLHVFGMASAALAAKRLLGRFETHAGWLALAVLAAMSSRILDWTAWLAKDDFGTALWTLASLSYLIGFVQDRGRTPRLAILGGLFGGAAFASKYTSAMNLAGLALTMAVTLPLTIRRKDLARDLPRLARGAAAALTAFVLAALPILARNFHYTGNPVFPTNNQHFHSPWLVDAITRPMMAFEGRVSFDRLALIAQRLVFLVRQDPLDLLLPLAALVLLLRGRLTAARLWLLFPLVSLTLFLAAVGPPVGDDGTMVLRILGAGHILLLGFGVLAVHSALGELKVARRRAGAVNVVGAVVGVLILAAALWQSEIPFDAPRVVGGSIAATPLRLRQLATGGEAKAWLRLNLTPNELVVTTGDNQLYYVAHLNVVALDQQPRLDHLANLAEEPVALLRVVRDTGARYLLDSHHFGNRYWDHRAAYLDSLVFEHPEALVYLGRSSYVADAWKLEAAVLADCPLQAPDPAMLELPRLW